LHNTNIRKISNKEKKHILFIIYLNDIFIDKIFDTNKLVSNFSSSWSREERWEGWFWATTYATDASFRLTHESASDLMTHDRYIH